MSSEIPLSPDETTRVVLLSKLFAKLPDNICREIEWGVTVFRCMTNNKQYVKLYLGDVVLVDEFDNFPSPETVGAVILLRG